MADARPPVALPAPRGPQSPRPPQDRAATARAFEAVFLGQMAKAMMESVPHDGPFSGGHGEEMFRGVLAEQLGDAMAKRGGIGLAPAVMEQMLKMQGTQP